MISRNEFDRLGRSCNKIKDFHPSPSGLNNSSDQVLFTVSSHEEINNTRSLIGVIHTTSSDVAAISPKIRIQAQRPGTTTWVTVLPYTDIQKGTSQQFVFVPAIQLMKGDSWRIQARTSSGTINLKIDQMLVTDYSLEISE
jgi:hypothetical protein